MRIVGSGAVKETDELAAVKAENTALKAENESLKAENTALKAAKTEPATDADAVADDDKKKK